MLHKESYFTQSEQLEVSILRVIQNYGSPVGAGLIFETLNDIGNMQSEATVSRVLRRLDHKNITERVGYQGRVITGFGKEYLQNLEERKKQNDYGLELITALSSAEEILDILAVRKLLEKESARLAAINTDRSINLQQYTDISQELLDDPVETTRMDFRFHEIIAEMSQNTILKTTLQLLMQNRDLHRITGYIRRRVGTDLNKDHIRIAKAIESKDGLEAETAMADHIETVIKDVQKYITLKNL